MINLVTKIAGWVLALLGTAFTIRSATKVPDMCPEYFSSICDVSSFMWWTLAFEWFCLVLFGALDVFGGLGRAYVAMTGLFVYASMQMQAVPWDLWHNDIPGTATNDMYAGYGLLFGANLFLATGMGLEHYVQPKLSDDKAPLPVDNKAGGEVRSMATIRRNGELLMTVRRWLGLALACVGLAGMVMALVLHAKLCEYECARNWWIYSVQLFAFAAYIVTEVILEVPSFRPVLTILLATQVGFIELWTLEASGEGADYNRQVAGVIIAISTSYILFLTLPGPVTSGPSSGRRTVLLGALPTVAALVGVILTYADSDFSDSLPMGRWYFARYLLALIWIMLSYVEKVPFLSDFRLPLVAFIASAIQFDTFVIHLVRVSVLNDYISFDEVEMLPLIGIIMRPASIVLVILVLGISWEGSTRPKSRSKGGLTSLYDRLKWQDYFNGA